jgi:hypothetical protein
MRRVKAGKNTSTVIPASRKRRRKGNPVVSDETEMYGYKSSTTSKLYGFLLSNKQTAASSQATELQINFSGLISSLKL